MKPFDLEKAKAGHPVCTRDGRDVRIVCFDRKGWVIASASPLVVLISTSGNFEEGAYYPINGIAAQGHNQNDLFMKTQTRKQKVYIAIPKKIDASFKGRNFLNCPVYFNLNLAKSLLNSEFSENHWVESEIEIDE